MDPNNQPLPDTKVPDTQEYFENASQVNANNYKGTHAAFENLTVTAASRSQVNFDNLQQISLRALNNSVDLQANLNKLVVSGFSQNGVDLAFINAQKLKHSDMWAYEQAYDLGNPVTTGAGDALRSAAYTPNRATDTATAGVAATVPASSDIRLIETVQTLASQLLAFAQQLQNSKQSAS